jgi:membrane-bound hydrogenase subunit beta
MTNGLMLDFVTDKMKEFGTVEQVRSNRIRILTTSDRIRAAIKTSHELLECNRLITISAADNGRTLELIYHLTGPHRMVISLALELPRDVPETPTMSDIFLSAGIYERQIHDLFGIFFKGHPNLKKIILNEDWPENEYPLRKDWKPDPGKFYGGIKVERI